VLVERLRLPGFGVLGPSAAAASSACKLAGVLPYCTAVAFSTLAEPFRGGRPAAFCNGAMRTQSRFYLLARGVYSSDDCLFYGVIR
jgi:hypothetical protein